MSWYVGGIIGSAAVATGRHMACGTTILDAISYARKHHSQNMWLVDHFMRHPEIYTLDHPARLSYGARARMQA